MLVDIIAKMTIITKEKAVVKKCNNYYINVVENCSGTKPNMFRDNYKNF